MRYINRQDADVYSAITDCLSKCKSVEHFKALLDLQNISYPRTSALDFAVWMHSQATSTCLRLRFRGAYVMWNGQKWTDVNLLCTLARRRRNTLLRSVGSGTTCVNAPRRMLLAWCRKNIDELVSRSLAVRWLVTKSTMKRGNLNCFGSLKDTLLYYWLKKHHRELDGKQLARRADGGGADALPNSREQQDGRA